MSYDMFVQAFDDGEAAVMPSPAFDVFTPHVDRQQPEYYFWHMRTLDGGEADIYADVTPDTFEGLRSVASGLATRSTYSPNSGYGLALSSWRLPGRSC
jgi:hypothetical protein